jgi:hypothetical protein
MVDRSLDNIACSSLNLRIINIAVYNKTVVKNYLVIKLRPVDIDITLRAERTPANPAIMQKIKGLRDFFFLGIGIEIGVDFLK